ncbi:hypothetical protein E4U21_000969 [Claviceps maximensis]|nr:hypothetical protein E4U21_000969 [Claviceps maximensis]
MLHLHCTLRVAGRHQRQARGPEVAERDGNDGNGQLDRVGRRTSQTGFERERADGGHGDGRRDLGSGLAWKMLETFVDLLSTSERRMETADGELETGDCRLGRLFSECALESKREEVLVFLTSWRAGG